MDQQLNQMVIQGILAPLEEKLLHQLNQKIYDHQKAKENWLEIYLTIFLLSNNTEVQLGSLPSVRSPLWIFGKWNLKICFYLNPTDESYYTG